MKTTFFFLLISVYIQAQDLKYASLNILSNSIIGGIGAGIHKKSGETFGHAFVGGVWKGSISGVLNYGSKKMLQVQSGKQNLDWKLCWSSKIVNSVSNTMLYNATINNNSWLDHYSINIGFIRLSTDYKVQIDPISLGCFGYAFIMGGKFNAKMSAITGVAYFNYSWKHTYIDSLGIKKASYEKYGITYAQNIIIQSDVSESIAVHELTHTYQRLQYSQINNLFKIYNKYENFKCIHNDLSSFDILYFFQNMTIGYKNNYFEKEAKHFAKF